MRSSFDDVRTFLKEAMDGEGFRQVLNLQRYLAPDGTFGMSRILHYENLQEEFEAVKILLGLPADLSLPHAKKGLLSNGMEIRDIFLMCSGRRMSRISIPLDSSPFFACGSDRSAGRPKSIFTASNSSCRFS